MSQQITVTLSYDGNQQPYGVENGTTAPQIAGNNYVRQLMGLPNNCTAMVNGAYSTGPVRNGDVITFQSAPSEKAEPDEDEDEDEDEAPPAAEPEPAEPAKDGGE